MTRETLPYSNVNCEAMACTTSLQVRAGPWGKMLHRANMCGKKAIEARYFPPQI
jgi:hypothetical protein